MQEELWLCGSTDHGKVWFGCLGHGLSKRNGRSQIGLNTARDIQEAVSTHDASGLCAAGSYPDVCPVQSTGSRGIVLDTSSPKKKRRRRRRRKGGGGSQGNPQNNGQQNGQSQNAPAKPKGAQKRRRGVAITVEPATKLAKTQKVRPALPPGAPARRSRPPPHMRAAPAAQGGDSAGPPAWIADWD